MLICALCAIYGSIITFTAYCQKDCDKCFRRNDSNKYMAITGVALTVLACVFGLVIA